MTIPPANLTTDRNQQFSDWATSITLRQVTQTFNPQTQQVTEDITDNTITAIIGNAPSTPTPGTAAQHLTGELQLHVKSEDLPNTAPTNRIIYAGTQYDIIAYHQSPTPQITTLTCRKTEN